MCTRISAPSSLVIPIACPVGNKADTVPETGANNLPSVGSIATPLPRAPDANAASLMSAKAITSPVSGLAIDSLFIFSILIAFFRLFLLDFC